MNTKDRQRQRDLQAPRAAAPAWLIVAVAGAVTAAALVARAWIA
ncbi:MAG TPA: hypothetical protein VFQ16_05850 [Burkholderiaceae bacterium]|nr:hypothetical protein [Burkholderiaceae bacterium]